MTFGPAEGTLLGLEIGDLRMTKEFAAERHRLLVQGKHALIQSQGYQAAELAAREVQNAIIDELAGADKGTVKLRRLSDPREMDALHNEFVTRCESHVNRISGGTVRMSGMRVVPHPKPVTPATEVRRQKEGGYGKRMSQDHGFLEASRK